MPETILIVDDEISQLRMAEFVVKEKLRYQTVTASGGQEAINHVVMDKGGAARPYPAGSGHAQGGWAGGYSRGACYQTAATYHRFHPIWRSG